MQGSVAILICAMLKLFPYPFEESSFLERRSPINDCPFGNDAIPLNSMLPQSKVEILPRIIKWLLHASTLEHKIKSTVQQNCIIISSNQKNQITVFQA